MVVQSRVELNGSGFSCRILRKFDGKKGKGNVWLEMVQ